jgi:hypothetical protein
MYLVVNTKVIEKGFKKFPIRSLGRFYRFVNLV